MCIISFARPAENSSLKFSWEPVQKALDANSSQEDYALYSYKKPNGQPLSYIIGGEAERIAVGASSVKRRETASKVFHVYSGEGYSEICDIKGNVTTLKWKNNDTFAVPSWYWVTHYATSSESNSAYLFSFNDKPLLENLNLYKAE